MAKVPRCLLHLGMRLHLANADVLSLLLMAPKSSLLVLPSPRIWRAQMSCPFLFWSLNQP